MSIHSISMRSEMMDGRVLRYQRMVLGKHGDAVR